MDTIARNHTPHTIAGIRPALAMTGRTDMLAVCGAKIWYNDPESVGDVAAREQNSMRNIPNARNAAIAASSRHALETLLSRNLPGRGKWVGACRVVAQAASNSVVEQGRRVRKWPKVKCRFFETQNDGKLDHVTSWASRPASRPTHRNP